METCARGFSFMSESKVEILDLQYIEGGKLERAWRSSRRERQKQREQKIWDEFVKEKDVVKDVFSDDPYQFLDQLPESCLKEIMDTELQKMSRENLDDEAKAKEKELAQGKGDVTGDENQHTCVVTFADDVDKDDGDMFYIFDDADEQSGGEEEANESASLTTVRERPVDNVSGNASPERPTSGDKASSKSSENVTNVIESSIYCAKVKDLRVKINEEFFNMMTSLDRRDILSAEPEDIARMIKRSAEFCNRFNRIYMYQLQRQMHDVKRNNSVTLPFAKHTQFQSQMVRIVSLHQNLLQAFQVFHKSFEQTCCVRESAAALGALLAAARDASVLCTNVPPPRDFGAAGDLYNDDLITTCDKFDEFVNEYAIRCEEFLNSFENVNVSYSKKVVKRVKKRSFGPWCRNTQKNNSGARLSMYSLDTLRLNLNAKVAASKDTNQSSGCTSKQRGGLTHCGGIVKRGQADKNVEQSKNPRKSPRSRRPLMRDPQAGQGGAADTRADRIARARASRAARDSDIRTMVEAVDTCASSHISREPSPPPPRPPAQSTARRNKSVTPRRTTPRSTHCLLPSPGYPQHCRSPSRRTQPSSPVMKSPTKTYEHREGRRLEPKPPNNLIATLSTIRSEMDSVDCVQVTPVCKIQCAMKKPDAPIEKEARGEKDSRRESDSRGEKDSHGERDSRGEKETREDKEPCVEKEIRGEKDTHGEKVAHAERDARRSEFTHASRQLPLSPTARHREEAAERRKRCKTSGVVPDRCEVTRLLKQLCSGDTSSRSDRVAGAKNAQLLYVNSNSPRQPSTPQLLRILEETIQKKVPKPLFQKPLSARGVDRYRLTFNICEKTTDMLFQYRTKFVQHMLTSSLYANSVVGKPWEMIGSVSEQLIDELLLGCMKEMELRNLVQELYRSETR